jgi:hypothetical protein
MGSEVHMSLPELTKELVVRIVSRVFKEDFWTIVFDDEAFAKTGERIWLINDVRRHKAGEKALTGRLEIPPWIWVNPDAMNQRIVLYQGAKELRESLDKLLSTTEGTA